MKTSHMPIRKKLLTQRKSSSTTGAKYRKWEGTNHLNLITLNKEIQTKSTKMRDRPAMYTAPRLQLDPAYPPTVPTGQAHTMVA